MKFIKRLPLDQSNATSQRFAVEIDDRIVTNSKTSLQLPSGTTGDRPSPTNGQIRYNETVDDAEIYNIAGDGTGWEKIRTNRQQKITPQNLGVGNYDNTIFGPLVYDISTTKPENILVFIDNVYQIPTTNYTLVAGAVTANTTTLAISVSTGTVTLTITDTTNVAVGQVITAPSGIDVSTTVTNFNSTTKTVTLSTSTTGSINSGTNLTFLYQSGTYINFTSAVPNKPVFCLLGFDGYSPL